MKYFKMKELVTVKLDVSKYGVTDTYDKGTHEGFNFYRKIGNQFDYITSRIGNNPVLVAVTKNQFKAWKNETFVALPTKVVIK